MKKVLAVFLAVLMAFSFVSMTAFAKVENSETVIDEILNGEYSHVNYVVNRKYFKTEIGVYTGLSLYDHAWDNFFTGSVDTNYAKTILLALIDRFEAEYNNETFEKIMSVLGAAKTGAEVVEKIDNYTGILELAENASWAKSLAVVNAALKVMNLGNKLYEQYVEAYAVILSCQAASIYYGDLLDYIAEKVDDKNVKAAAAELKENITTSLDEATDKLISELAEAASKEGVSIAIDAAMSTNTVTTVISTVYGAIGSIGDKVFATKDKYMYMSSLAMLTKIEDVMPAYVNNVLASADDETAKDFAVCSILTMRETGETMLASLGKVTEDAIVEKLVNSSNMTTTIENAAMAAAKLSVYGDLLKDETSYKVVDVYTSIGSNKKVTLKDKDGVTLVIVPNGKEYVNADPDCQYYAVNKMSNEAGKYVQVVVACVEGTSVINTTVSSGTGSTQPSNNKTGFAAIFQSFIDAIVNAIKSLFSFGKK